MRLGAGISTTPAQPSRNELKRARVARRVGIVALTAFVALGCADVFGSRTSRVGAQARGYGLTVTYPAVTRPGLPVRWEVEVRRTGGSWGPITLRTTLAYLRLFDISDVEPAPSSSTAGADTIDYSFAPPPGDVLRVWMDGAAEPDEHAPTDATTTLLVGGVPVTSVTYRTVMVP